VKPFSWLRHAFIVGFLVAFVAACTSHESNLLPAPAASLSVAAARTWYETNHAPTGTTSAKSAVGDSATRQPWALNWARAITLSGPPPVVLVPLRGDQSLFAGKPIQGTRYLVIAQHPNTPAPAGLIVELLLQRTATPVDTAALFASFYTSYRTGRPAAPAQGQGVVLFYSADYRYLTGRRFSNGAIQPGAVRLSFHKRQPTPATPKTTPGQPAHRDASICTDWYQLNDDGSRTYITTTGDCSYPGGGGSGSGDGPFGGGGDGGWGGNNGGGGTGGTGGDGSGGDGGTVQCRACPDGTTPVATLKPNVILVISPPPTHQIQNVPEHLKCFNKSQGASFSVYATQPKPGTRATWSGSALRPDVGHTFISITQGGTTRVIGFYPSAGITPFNPTGPSTLADDSDHDYSVRIDISLTPAQLGNVLNYIISYPGVYDLNHYNCTGFGIGAARAAGLLLPATEGSWGPGAGGLNPGDLGEDMRTMPLPAGASRDIQSGQADSDNGSC